MFEYLNDATFLQELDKYRLRTQYAKLILLSFDDEKPLKEIQGTITSGTLNINGSSAVRRTISFSMNTDMNSSDITNLDNDIALNKKIQVFIGYKNPTRKYKEYGDIIWFPCGMFIISSANISRGTSSWNISVSAKDKMVMLDGSVGGRLPASVTFHEEYTYLDNGDIKVTYPTIIKIIREAVNHWGNEPVTNIFINDLEETAKLLIKYVGDQPIYMNNDYTGFEFEYSDEHPIKYEYNDDVGYRQTDFTYPGELILKAGDTVVTLLNKICNVLGNYEFFYDVYGHFIFQEKKNYLNTGSPLLEMTTNDYIYSYSNTKHAYSLTSLDNVTSIASNPKYDNIKNDFIVWGKRKLTSGAEVEIHYHLAIDTKPELDLCTKYMWKVLNNGEFLRYEYTDTNVAGKDGYTWELESKPGLDWREELYRKAKEANMQGLVNTTPYDMELLAFWRQIYDPNNKEFRSDGWNPIVYNDPKKLNFWLDFIDDNAAIGKYSVNMIGRRTKVINNNNIKIIYSKEVPDIMFLNDEQWEDQEKRAEYDALGQKYFRLTKYYDNLFVSSSTGESCFDKIREMLYQNLVYNTQITIQGLPKYYLEPNNLIYVEDAKSHIVGNYEITSISLPLSYNGTMSITATEVLTRV